jgi:hypothetical protein
MGRAQRSSRASANGFDAAFGTRRGLGVLVQASRDVEETREREHFEREQRERELRAYTGLIKDDCGSCSLADFLVCMYATKVENERHRRRLKKATSKRLVQFVKEPRAPWVELAALAWRGDPQHCPGLTAPAVKALCDYFTSPPHSHRHDGIADEHGRGALAVMALPQHTAAEDYPRYERLRPLWESMARFIASQGENSNVSAQGQVNNFCGYAVTKLLTLPTELITGPFCSWVDAFTVRIIKGVLTGDEEDAFKNAAKRRGDDSDFMWVFDGIIQRLEGKSVR